MSRPAQVRSIGAIERMAAALARFQERVQSALDALEVELRRADDWVEHDRPHYWKEQTRLAEAGLHQAKVDLDRCLLMTVVEGERPACREQKAALAAAKARVEYCRDKSERVKHWQRNFRHEMLEFSGRIGQLRRLVEQDSPEARGALMKIVHKLEEYRLEGAPQAFNSGAEQGASPAAAIAPRAAPPTDDVIRDLEAGTTG